LKLILITTISLVMIIKTNKRIKISFYRNPNGSFFILSRDYEKLNNLQDRNKLIEWILVNYKDKERNI